jgi:hypothetical protein
LPYKPTGGDPGRPRKKDRADVSKSFTVSPSVRSWAILEIARKRRRFPTLGALLDDVARDLLRDLNPSAEDLQKEVSFMLDRFGIK